MGDAAPAEGAPLSPQAARRVSSAASVEGIDARRAVAVPSIAVDGLVPGDVPNGVASAPGTPEGGRRKPRSISASIHNITGSIKEIFGAVARSSSSPASSQTHLGPDSPGATKRTAMSPSPSRGTLGSPTSAFGEAAPSPRGTPKAKGWRRVPLFPFVRRRNSPDSRSDGFLEEENARSRRTSLEVLSAMARAAEGDAAGAPPEPWDDQLRQMQILWMGARRELELARNGEEETVPLRRLLEFVPLPSVHVTRLSVRELPALRQFALVEATAFAPSVTMPRSCIDDGFKGRRSSSSTPVGKKGSASEEVPATVTCSAFGMALEGALDRDARRVPGRRHSLVPFAVEKMIAHLEREGVSVQGIFRVSGSAKRMKQLRTLFETSDEIDLSPFTAHDVGGLLKMYLRELPEPLLTAELYSGFLATGGLDAEEQVRALRLLCLLLPACSRNVLEAVLQLLGRIADHARDVPDGGAAGNKMDSYNLALVFGPNVLHRPAAQRGHLEMEHMQEQLAVVGVVRALIENREAVFQVPGELIAKVVFELGDLECDLAQSVAFRPWLARLLSDGFPRAFGASRGHTPVPGSSGVPSPSSARAAEAADSISEHVTSPPSEGARSPVPSSGDGLLRPVRGPSARARPRSASVATPVQTADMPLAFARPAARVMAPSPIGEEEQSSPRTASPASPSVRVDAADTVGPTSPATEATPTARVSICIVDTDAAEGGSPAAAIAAPQSPRSREEVLAEFETTV